MATVHVKLLKNLRKISDGNFCPRYSVFQLSFFQYFQPRQFLFMNDKKKKLYIEKDKFINQRGEYYYITIILVPIS